MAEPIDALVDEIASDRTRGAAELARRALEGLAALAGELPAADAGELREALRSAAAAVARARPAMAPITQLARRWAEQLPEGDGVDRVRREAAESARAAVERSRSAVRRAASLAADRVPEGAAVITLSSSSTVRAAFEELARRRTGVSAIVGESRPGFEGRDTARFLAGLGIPVQLVTDAQLGLFAGEADCALVGADAVLADGSVVNKAGTYLLALACREAGTPFYVVAESFKGSPLGPDEHPLEEQEAGALGAPAEPGVTARNLPFDRTPAELVTAWIREDDPEAGSPPADE